MRKRTTWGVCLPILCLGLATAMRLEAQMAGKDKPPVYTYVAEWDVPRAQWGDIVKLDEQDRPLLDKLVADGTIVGYGAYTNLIHQEGQPTHGSWFTAMSEGNLLKALEAIYAQPGSVSAPVQGASKHWDQIFTGDIYNGKPGTSSGYLLWSRWEIKPGEMRSYSELTKSSIVPIMEKLLAEGSITSYGLLREDFHQQKLGTVYQYITLPNASALDQVNKALQDAFKDSPAYGDAVQALADREGHQDFLTRLRFMVTK
jgi:hypothetical protein